MRPPRTRRLATAGLACYLAGILLTHAGCGGSDPTGTSQGSPVDPDQAAAQHKAMEENYKKMGKTRKAR